MPGGQPEARQAPPSTGQAQKGRASRGRCGGAWAGSGARRRGSSLAWAPRVGDGAPAKTGTFVTSLEHVASDLPRTESGQAQDEEQTVSREEHVALSCPSCGTCQILNLSRKFPV